MPRKKSMAALLSDSLREGIERGDIPAGTVLTEQPVAAMLGVSRAPVRSAFAQLVEAGLVHRSGARGVVVGHEGVEARNERPEEVLASLELFARPRVSFTWQVLYDTVEAQIVHRSFFGRSRVNEVELARHFDVGRTVAKDVLLKLESRGLIEKDEAARWSVVPLDEVRIRNLYRLRELLEPEAIAGAATVMTDQEIRDMRQAHHDGLARYATLAAADMFALETLLHIDCVGRTPNGDLAKVLQRTQCLLTLSKHTVGTTVAKLPREAFFEDHIAIFDAMLSGDDAAIRSAVRRHICGSVDGVVERAALARQATPEVVSYLK